MKTTLKGKIMNISESVPGSMHDYALRKLQPALDKNERAYVDSGYQGLQNEHPATELPFKTSKHQPLDEESKLYNTALSKIRVKVEHVFGDIKVFGIMKDVYRNSRESYNQKFIIIAGLVNARNGFGI
jgi:IS5 family transposase